MRRGSSWRQIWLRERIGSTFRLSEVKQISVCHECDEQQQLEDSNEYFKLTSGGIADLNASSHLTGQLLFNNNNPINEKALVGQAAIDKLRAENTTQTTPVDLMKQQQEAKLFQEQLKYE